MMNVEKKLERMKKRIEAETGCKCKIMTLYKWSNDPSTEYKGLMVEHNYDGMYPHSGIWQSIDAIRAIVRRYKGFKAEDRGFYTATLIYAE